MKKDLVVLMASSSTVCAHSTVLLVKDSGNFVLILHLAMELNLTYFIMSLQ